MKGKKEDIIKLTVEELEVLKSIQSRTTEAMNEFGLIAYAEIDLNQRKLNTEAFVRETKSIEVDLLQRLEKQYGYGTIDIDTGVFTPTPK